MALQDRDIIITPNRGQSTEPLITFRGADASSSATITLRVINSGTVGTLSFEGTAGQLFSLSDDLTGTIFSVNDVSGIPSIEVYDSGEIRLAEYNGYVNIVGGTPTSSTTTGVLQVAGGVGIGGGLFVGGTVTATNFVGSFSGVASGASLTSTYVGYGSGSNTLTGSSALTWDGTILSVIGPSNNGYINFATNTGPKLRFYDAATDKYGIEIQSSELRIYSGAQGAATGGTTIGKYDGTTFTEYFRFTNSGGFAVGGSSNYGTSGYVLKSNANASPTWVNPNTLTAGNVNGIVAVANGGTGQTTRKAASGSIANFGQLENHGTYTDFNLIKQWGGTFVQGTTNSPGWQGSQYYQMMLSLGANYEWGTSNVYAMQLAFPRNISNPYVGIRFKEGGTDELNWGSWTKISAGYADSAGSAGTASSATTADQIDSWPFRNTGSNAGIAANTLDQNGHTYVTNVDGSSTNLTGYSTDGALYSQAYSSSWQHQIYGDYRSGDIWVRGKNNNSWQTWKKIPSIVVSDTAPTWNAVAGDLWWESDTGKLKIYYNDGSSSQWVDASPEADLSTYYSKAGGPISGSVGINGALDVSGNITAGGEITAYYTSDKRLKENIRPLENPLDKLNQIRGVRFDWTDEYIEERGGEDGFAVRKEDVGVIAQEIEEVLPEVVATRTNGFKAVRYEKIAPLLIESIKEQQKIIEQLTKRIETLEKQNNKT